ncbi:MAG: hypothetical protein ACYC0Z_13010 [Acidobacteriaceae bacterium]
MPTIPFSLIAKLVGMLALVGVGFGLGYKFEHGDMLAAQSALTAYKATQEAASQKAIADQAQQVSVLRDAISQGAIQSDKQIQSQYARNLQLARRVRLCSGSDHMPKASGTAASGDAAGQPGVISGSALANLARDADRDRETALECQRWAVGISK